MESLKRLFADRKESLDIRLFEGTPYEADLTLKRLETDEIIEARAKHRESPPGRMFADVLAELLLAECAECGLDHAEARALVFMSGGEDSPLARAVYEMAGLACPSEVGGDAPFGSRASSATGSKK